MQKQSGKLPRGVVAGPIAAIGSLAFLLSAGFGMMGVLDDLNASTAQWVESWGLAGTARPVAPWIAWLCCAAVAYGFAAALLVTPGIGRRLMIWISGLVLLFCWVPVLALAAWKFPVSAPLTAALWSGASSLVYTLRHRMPCDAHAPSTSRPHSHPHPRHH
jgi:hypothetical protein